MTPARPKTFDVVIAGGSYAGLALALALARALGPDADLAVIDRAPLDGGQPASDPRAFALAEASRLMLAVLGVWPALEAHAEPVRAIDLTDSALSDVVRPVLLSYDPTIGPQAQMHILEATRLKAALLAAVRAEPTIRLLAPAEVRGLERHGSAIRLRLGDGSAVEARLAVAADGVRSALRAAAGIGIVAHSFNQLGIVTIVAHERPHEGRAVQHFLPGGPFAMLPLPGQRCCISWSEDAARGQAIMSLADADFLAEAQHRAGYRLGALTLAGPRASWPLEAQLVRSLVATRLALIGDAARSVHPIAGQGVNLGLRDAAALAEVLVDGLRLGLEPGDATSLERYERWRRFDGFQSAAAFSALNTLFSNDWAVLRGLRDLGVGLVDRLPVLKGLLVAEAAGHTGEVPRLLKGEPL